MKTKGVKKFLRCLKPEGILHDAEKQKGKKYFDDDDLGHEDIFVSSNNSFNERGKPKGDHKKFPHFLKGMFRASSSLVKLARNKSKVNPSSGTTTKANSALATPRLDRNSSDSSSIFTSSSMASSSLASSGSNSYVPSKLRSTPQIKKMYPTDSKQTTIESHSIGINNNIYKQALIDKVNGCYFGSSYAICFLILGLMALLTWGKIFAVFCTALCLLFARPRRLKVIHNNSQLLLDDKLSILEVSEKHVVMEGF